MKMNNATIFIISCLVSFIATLLFIRSQKRAKPKTQDTPLNKEWKLYTREEVSKHNKANDLWVYIKLKDSNEIGVYNLTEYVDEHPGGDSILNNAGGDSTEGFYGLQHPPRALELLPLFRIGTLKDA